VLILTWVAAGVVATVHLISGINKLLRSNQLIPRRSELSLGVLEILGSIGLIVPKIVGIAAWLAPLAALCFVVLQIGAGIFHIRRKEFRVLPINCTLTALALFAALSWLLWVR